MQIEIWLDVICPWCYIGKRHFEKALAQFGHRENANIIWRSFELDPNAPPQYPVSLEELLARKYGVSLQQASLMNARVTGIAHEAGLEYSLANASPGNTFDAHRLLHFASARQLGERAIERIMQAYFREGLAISDRAALARLAPEFGITESDALEMLESDDYSGAVCADESRAAEFGITSVPFFLFDEKSGISGALPVEVFAEALQQAWDGSSNLQNLVSTAAQGGLTLADLCLVPQVFNARRLEVPLDAFPKIVAAEAACLKLSAFDKARPENQPDAE